MYGLSTEVLLIILCCLVVVSYVFSILSQIIKIPSVLLLLFAGILFRLLADSYGLSLVIPPSIVQGLGVVGLIMIVLEAGLDLRVTTEKISLIRESFLAALLILVISTATITGILNLWLKEDLIRCIVYAIPLSIMSSSIVLPSIHHLTPRKKEFLVYEASFSDIIGIIIFNYFTASEILTLTSLGWFGGSIVIAVLLSLVLSYLLFLILARSRMDIKFFLVFALLILIYSGGKLLHLPSLLIILVFGLMIKNWRSIPVPQLQNLFPAEQTDKIQHLMHSLTAESSFLIRTFFFIFFGFTIDLKLLNNQEVVLVGSACVTGIFVIRWLYLRFVFKTQVFPEVFFIPRGLITIVLFYKIPTALKLESFNDGILFFIILSTSIILSIGMILYKKDNADVIEDPQFSERKDLA